MNVRKLILCGFFLLILLLANSALSQTPIDVNLTFQIPALPNGADSLWLRFVTAKDSISVLGGGVNVIQDSSWIRVQPGTQVTVPATFPGDIPTYTYYWGGQMRGHFTSGTYETSVMSNIFHFTLVINGPILPPTLISPANGSTITR